MERKAKVPVRPIRQSTQYNCVTASTAMCLEAQGIAPEECTTEIVNKVLGALPMQGASWENVFACAQHYGMRVTFFLPATLRQVKEYTDRGIPVMIAWNPEGRPWSHASVIFDVEDDLTVHVADPNMPDPDETVRIVPKAEFYSKWYEKWPSYLVRRPAVAIEREITVDGRQVVASMDNPMDKTSLDKSLALLEEAAGVETDMEELRQLASQFSISTDETADKKRSASPGDKEAREHGGLYGFTKRTQKDCESAIGKLSKVSNRLAREAYNKSEKSAAFLKTHVERSDNLSARILLSAMENIGPKFATENIRGNAKLHMSHGDGRPHMGRVARRHGLYGFPHKVSRIGLDACSTFRDEASKVAIGLHQRRTAQHGKITGFLGRHGSEGGCQYSSMLLRHYPDEGQKLGSYVPQTMEEWLDMED